MLRFFYLPVALGNQRSQTRRAILRPRPSLRSATEPLRPEREKREASQAVITGLKARSRLDV